MTARELQKLLSSLAYDADEKARVSRGVMRMRWIMVSNALSGFHTLVRDLFKGRTINTKWRDE